MVLTELRPSSPAPAPLLPPSITPNRPMRKARWPARAGHVRRRRAVQLDGAVHVRSGRRPEQGAIRFNHGHRSFTTEDPRATWQWNDATQVSMATVADKNVACSSRDFIWP
jgi:hypothetical protein